MRAFTVMSLVVCAAAAIPGRSLAAAISTRPAAGLEISLKKGDLVRIKGAGLEGVFVLEELQPEVLVLRDPDGVMPQSVRIADISSLAVGVPRSAGQGAAHGAVIGGVLGAVTGLVVGFADGDDPPDESISLKAETKASLLGLVGMVGGAVVGAVAGMIHPGERWEPIPAQLGAGIARDGTVRVGIAFSIRGL
jgi:hypothetical protein